MLKRLILAIIPLAAMLAFVFWFVNQSPDNAPQANAADAKLKIVATNSILGDMVHEVGGDRVSLHVIVPRGTDPHEYEPKPQNVAAVNDADILFHNGLDLETGGNGWFKEMYENAGKRDGEQVFAASTGVVAQHLTDKGKENELDPHAWLDIQNGIIYVKNITKIMIEKDPANADYFQERSDKYVAKLQTLDSQAKTMFKQIPADKRLLVTSEGAFKYFSKAYSLTPAFIWEINTESQGTPEQMRNVLDKIHATKVPVLFLESSVSPKSMEKVAKETGLPIYSTLFTDSLAKAGVKGDTYYSMMKWNLDKIRDGLNQ